MYSTYTDKHNQHVHTDLQQLHTLNTHKHARTHACTHTPFLLYLIHELHEVDSNLQPNVEGKIVYGKIEISKTHNYVVPVVHDV